MNVREASEQIEGAVRAYLERDERGLLRIPFAMQRPLIIMGPPGVGKTAIVAQVAEKMGVSFVSYSITHHTRQSALGLPYIAEEEFGGVPYRVSRYTMSEIIAAVHDAIRESGVAEGILFLDEVNCASETLMPSMLQFLQYKQFGQHHLPEGWAIVCAGNPPEYNRAARDFDPAMMDRLKRIDVEADLDVWLDYAAAHGVHPAITTYLSAKPKNFFRVRAAASGARIVTARGWEDLSRMLGAYERQGRACDAALVSQYLQDLEVAEDFALYLELFGRYRDDYKVEDILDGSVDDAIAARAQAAPFDERVALVNMLADAIAEAVRDASAAHEAVLIARERLVGARAELAGAGALSCAEELVVQLRHELDEARGKGLASAGRQAALAGALQTLEASRRAVALLSMGDGAHANGFEAAKAPFNEATLAARERVEGASEQLDHVLAFLERAFGEGQEMVLLVGKLAVDPVFMRFVSTHGSDSFARHSQALMFQERGLDLLREAERLASLDEL